MRFFRRGAEVDAEGFVDTGVAATAVVAEAITAVKIQGRNVALTRWEGQLYAFSNICPHAAARLSDGTLSRWKVTCPDHGYCFDIRSGQILWPEDEFYRLPRYPVKEEAGTVRVKLE